MDRQPSRVMPVRRSAQKARERLSLIPELNHRNN